MHALNFAVGNPTSTPFPHIKEAVKVDDSRKMEISHVDSALSVQRLFQVDQKSA